MYDTMVDFDSEEQQHPVSQGQWQIFNSMVDFDSEEQQHQVSQGQ